MRNQFASLALAATLAIAGGSAGRSQSESASSAPRLGPWGFEVTGIDAKAIPGDSFYDYANGAWDATTPIPADKSRFGMFDALRDKAQEQVHAIIEDNAVSRHPRHRGGQDRRALQRLHGRSPIQAPTLRRSP
jgi:predicted metalloendopeptidase